MELEIFNCEQGTPEWHQCRKGVITASRFADVMAKGKGGAPSEMRRKYMYDLASEIISGELTESFSNGAMERGKALEAEARDVYALITGTEPELIGFMRRGPIGCSPDALVLREGAKRHLTIKTRLGRLQLELLEEQRMPTEHQAQTQGEMLVSGLECSDFFCYSKGHKHFLATIHRDELYIVTLQKCLTEFRQELDDLVKRHRQG